MKTHILHNIVIDLFHARLYEVFEDMSEVVWVNVQINLHFIHLRVIKR